MSQAQRSESVSDTPRTDKVQREWPRESFGAMAEHARTLERDRGDLVEALRDYVAWGAMTGSERDMFEHRFRELIAKHSKEPAHD